MSNNTEKKTEVQENVLTDGEKHYAKDVATGCVADALNGCPDGETGLYVLQCIVKAAQDFESALRQAIAQSPSGRIGVIHTEMRQDATLDVEDGRLAYASIDRPDGTKQSIVDNRRVGYGKVGKA